MTSPTWASARDAEASTWTDKWHPYKGNLCDSAYRGGGFNGFKAGADFGRSWAESCHKKTPEIMTDRDDEAERWTKRRAGHRQMAIAFSDLHDGFIAGWDACRASLLSQLQAAEEREVNLVKALVEAQEYGHEVDCSLDVKEGRSCDCRLSVLEAALALRDGGGEKG